MNEVPKDFKTHVIINVIRLRCLVIMQHNRLSATECLDYYFINFLFEKSNIDILGR